MRYRVVALAINDTGLDSDVVHKALGIPIYHSPDALVAKQYGFGGTPDTWVISERGTILKRWSGAWIPDVRREIEQYFNVMLPGLVEISSTVDSLSVSERGEIARAAAIAGWYDHSSWLSSVLMRGDCWPDKRRFSPS